MQLLQSFCFCCSFSCVFLLSLAVGYFLFKLTQLVGFVSSSFPYFMGQLPHGCVSWSEDAQVRWRFPPVICYSLYSGVWTSHLEIYIHTFLKYTHISLYELVDRAGCTHYLFVFQKFYLNNAYCPLLWMKSCSNQVQVNAGLKFQFLDF